MNSPLFKNLRFFLFLSFLTLFLSSCSYHKNPINGTNDFQSLVAKLVDKSANKINDTIAMDEIVLVSDFVNIDKLENKSQLGFLLSNILKDELASLNIVVREIEFGKEFQLGKKGFNVLIRDRNKIVSNKVSNSSYAVVGTYSITSRSLNLFLKLIDIETGYILASSFERTAIDEEILELEGETKRVFAQPPRIVL